MKKETIAIKTVRGAVQRISHISGEHEWSGEENLPAQGGFIVCANHTTYLDSVILAHFLHDHNIIPSFLAKQELFNIPFIGKTLAKTSHIPVARDTHAAANALVLAERVLARNGVVVIYPEGTFTKDPQLWPMRGKTGVARLALLTGASVIPVAQWGTNDVMHRDSIKMKVIPRKKIKCGAGPAVDLTEFYHQVMSRELLEKVTDKIMHDVMQVLAGLRQEPAPDRLWDPFLDGPADGRVLMPSFRVQKKRARSIVRAEIAANTQGLIKNLHPINVKKSRRRYWEILGNKEWQRYEEKSNK